MDSTNEEEEVMFILVLIAIVLAVEKYKKKSLARQPYRTPSNLGLIYTNSLIGVADSTCRSMLRMTRKAFFTLEGMLVDSGLLKGSKAIGVKEQLAMFLHTIGHNAKNRTIGHNFGHSGETVSRYFNIVLQAVLHLYPHLLTPPSTTTHEKILRTRQSFYPYFKDCVGAVDGSHIDAWVPVEDHKRFRDRHGRISQNIIAACDHDMRFTYILSGWEGSASDSRILDDALNRHAIEARFVVPAGKYYLVDAGYANRTGFLRPYRNVRYHLKEWENSNLAPANNRELFNLRHAKLRNVIERAFVFLKSRFKILKYGSEYPFDTQSDIVLACVLIHNHILTQDSIEEEERWIEDESDEEDMDNSTDEPSQGDTVVDDMFADDDNDEDETVESTDWEKFRDDIADKMWVDWIGGNIVD